MNESHILVTGAGGFLGSHIWQYFAEQGHPVVLVGRFASEPPKKNAPYILNVHEMTLPDKSFHHILRELRPTLIIHCAGSASVPASVANPYADFQNNVDVLAFILECVRKESPGSRFILLSSAAVYGNPRTLPIQETMQCRPISPYGYHKNMCELLADEYSTLYGIPIAILRIFSAYGERLHKQVIFDLCKKFADHQTDQVEIYGTGKETRDFIHAQDVARAIECIHATQATGIFNIASGVQTPISELAHLIKETCGSKKTIRYTGTVREGDPLYWCADIRKISALGFCQKISLIKGVERYHQWFDSHWNRGLI